MNGGSVPPVVLVDLDGLLRGAAFTSVIIHALLRRPWKLPAAAAMQASKAATTRLSPTRWDQPGPGPPYPPRPDISVWLRPPAPG